MYLRVSNNARIQEKFEKFWKIESFETKITNDILHDKFCNGIGFTEGES